MFIALLRKLFLTLVTLFILSLMSYHILLRDPLNEFADLGYVQSYFYYVQDLLKGNFGLSYTNGEPLTEQILNVLPATITLCLAAFIVSLLFGVPLGFLAAYQQKNVVGKTLTLLGSLSLSIPVFWLAIVLLYYAALHKWAISAVGELHPLYDIQSQTHFRLIDIFLTDSPYKLKMVQSTLHHLALPTLILAIPATLETIRIVQKRAEYVMKQNYIKVAYTRGLSAFLIWKNHLLGNTLFALIPQMARNLTLIFAFSMLIENIFSWGGIGRWLINALSEQNYNAISAGVVAIGLFVLSVDLIASLFRGLLDPSHKKDWYANT